MQLGPGTRLAHYEISALLGKGGMGEVWRAKDTKLGREVAIKVLPDEFVRDAERLARFEREARLLASLDHSNVAAIHGIEEFEGTKFLVMQLAPGEDLAECLTRGAIPLEEALPIARQIAEALEAAHEQGIIHRDLKPANIKLDENGNVKVLDFGLAKALESEESEEDFSNSPTMVRAATHAGVILGTAGYMSPEQARGKKVDKRADIWAFGVVIWEMLTGKRLFTGETVSDTLASVLRADVDLSELPDKTPNGIRTMLRRCLERNPRNRLHDVADARLVIDDVIGNVDASGPVAASSDSSRKSRMTALAWIGVIVVVAIAAAWAGRRSVETGDAASAPQRFAIHLAPNQEVVGQVLEFSGDGQVLAFPGRVDGRQTILRRDLGEADTKPISGTDFGGYAFFSPDGKWIGFASEGKLKKVPVEGGRPLELADARGAGGATWLGDDTIVFAPSYSDGLFRMNAQGGTLERLTSPDRDDGVLGHWWPDPLPGERKVVFTAFRTPVDRSRIGVLDLDTKAVEWIVDGGLFARYVSTGHLLYAKENRLFSVRIDSKSGRLQGSPVQVLDDVYVEATNGSAAYAVSSAGTLAYVRREAGDPVRELVWLDREGRSTPVTEERRGYRGISISPDGTQAALTIQGDSLDIWVYSFARGIMSRVTSGGKSEYDAFWTPDGKELLYVVDSPPFELHRTVAAATDAGRPIFDEKSQKDTFGVDVSPDGKTISYTASDLETGEDLFLRPFDGSEDQRVLRATRAVERYSTFSPDGKWIAYRSNETGRPEIYVESLSGSGERVQITADGGDQPRWIRNGEIFYRRFDELWVVAVRTGEKLSFDAPQKLFSFPMAPGVNESALLFDVTADGERIITSRIPDALRSRDIEIVTNWTSTLK